MKKSPNKGISRIESKESSTFGWYVRVRMNGEVRSKLFSDGKYGGAAQALNKARRYHKQEMRKIFEKTVGVAPAKLPNCILVTKNIKNNTGMIGVQKIERKNSSGSKYHAYRVSWKDKTTGKPRTKFFSIRRYGDEKAFELACEYRRQRIFER